MSAWEGSAMQRMQEQASAHQAQVKAFNFFPPRTAPRPLSEIADEMARRAKVLRDEVAELEAKKTELAQLERMIAAIQSEASE